jgi:hypothetical protein
MKRILTGRRAFDILQEFYLQEKTIFAKNPGDQRKRNIKLTNHLKQGVIGTKNPIIR